MMARSGACPLVILTVLATSAGAAPPTTSPASAPASRPTSQPAVSCPAGTTWSEEEAAEKEPERSVFCVDKSGVPQGPIVSWHGDTAVRSFEGTFVGGKLHGPFRAWGLSGRLQRAGQFRQGKLHGTVTTYHENGARAAVETWNSGRLVAIREWDQRGSLVPQPRLIFRGLSASSRLLVRGAVSFRGMRRALAKAVPGATATALELRWDGRASALTAVFHVPVAGIPRATLQGAGYLDSRILEQLSQAVMPSNMKIAEAVGASEYGGTGPRLEGHIRLVGRSRAVEFEMNCSWDSDYCGVPMTGLQCHQAGRRPVTTFFDIGSAEQGMIIIDDAVDLGGKQTGTRCFHDLWN